MVAGTMEDEYRRVLDVKRNMSYGDHCSPWSDRVDCKRHPSSCEHALPGRASVRAPGEHRRSGSQL